MRKLALTVVIILVLIGATLFGLNVMGVGSRQHFVNRSGGSGTGIFGDRKAIPQFWKFEEGGTAFIDRVDRVVLITARGEAERGRITHWPEGVSDGMLRVRSWQEGKTLTVPWTKNSLICISIDGRVTASSLTDAQVEAFWQTVTQRRLGFVTSQDLSVLGLGHSASHNPTTKKVE
jgi:hypothetical protein